MVSVVDEFWVSGWYRFDMFGVWKFFLIEVCSSSLGIGMNFSLSLGLVVLLLIW